MKKIGISCVAICLVSVFVSIPTFGQKTKSKLSKSSVSATAIATPSSSILKAANY